MALKHQPYGPAHTTQFGWVQDSAPVKQATGLSVSEVKAVIFMLGMIAIAIIVLLTITGKI